ncbi:MAG TPA: tryptophan synthase subunit alpha, partial [Burkholderiaceae bacterium]|nr:tryptophan synthase subunit alpha [Burkholderiaceae bacterium]
QVLEMVAEFRKQDQVTPVVFMGYANTIERMGQQAFVDAAVQVGLDGILVVDYPPEEVAEFAAMLGKARIDPIFLLAPTSTEARIQAVAKVARGYVYYVSLKGVTGAGHLDTQDVARRLEIIRRHVKIPVGVGFGIRDPESARQLASCADAVVIGSKIIETMEEAVRAAEAEGLSGEQADARAIESAAQWLAGIRAVLG